MHMYIVILALLGLAIQIVGLILLILTWYQSNRVIAAITLMFRTVPKKNTLNRLSSEFGALTRWK